MERGASDRGVSEVIGFILVFAMLVTAFTVYQGIVVPDQNRQVEFQHNLNVQGQLQDLRNAIVTTASTGTGQAVSITLGAAYPKRTIASNLGVSAGSLTTADLDGAGVRLDNVTTSDDEVRDYVNGSLGPFPTRSITYTPVYSFYSDGPETVYENSIAFNRFDNTTIELTDQLLIDGRRITIITLDGSLSEAEQGTVSLSTEPVSVSTNRVDLQNNESSRPITITIPTTLSAEEWREIVGEEYDPSGTDSAAYVSTIENAGQNRVAFVLEPGETYELRMATVGVGDAIESPPVHYLSIVSGDGAGITAGATQMLVVEARDRYNNPVSGVSVNVSSVSGGSVSPADSKTTDSDGEATFQYTAPGSPGSETVTFSIGDNPSGRKEVTFSIDVRNDGVGGGSGGAFGVQWQSPPSTDPGTQPDCTAEVCTWDLSDDTDDALTLTAMTDPTLDGLDVDYAVDDSNVASITSASAQTNPSGAATVDLQALANGTVGVYVASGGSSDVITLTLQNVGAGGLSYNDDASASPGTGTENSAVQFSVTNQHSDAITIDAITINDSTAGTQVRETDAGQSEVVIVATGDGEAEAGDGFFSAGYDVGQRIDLTSTATVSSGGTADITFYELRDDSGFLGTGSPVEMSGEAMTVTIHYVDGNGDSFARTFTVSIP